LKVLLIGQFVEPPFAEGIINTLLNWAKAARHAGVDVSILSTSSKYSGRQNISGLTFEYIKTDHPHFEGNIVDLLSIQRESLKRYDFDIMHFGFSADHLPAIPALTLLKLQGHKIVNSYHTCHFARSYPLLRNFAFNAATVPSKRMLHIFMEKQILRDIKVIPPCVDENRFRPRDKHKIREQLGLEQEVFTVFTIGHFKRGRSIIKLIKIVDELTNQGNRIQLLVGWTGHGEIDYVTEVFKAVDNKLVKIIPPTEKINLYYNASDVYVLSANLDYVIEAPLSLIEASFSGIPTMAFNINAVSEIIQDGRTGYVIKDNNFAILKSRLNQLMKDARLSEELSRNSRDMATKTFSYERIGGQLCTLYRELVNFN
jgi:glycosyltransferase involved in cell wall biosynthesis